MKFLKVVLAMLTLALALTACGEDDGEQFIGKWQGVNKRDNTFTYTIERERDTFNLERQMNNFDPRMYKATATDKNTLTRDDGDVLLYNEENDTISSRADNITLSRIE
ncbi:hypothetical protein SAMN05421848_3099 [Kushneria avicenniae]|uniref:Lipoprotein n=1 Tax=Kushneria avicenniae TaxID=402385 RepID=A0A1I1MR31_9GAMM|nr:hypothetical protein [Kushneria avicenniae]SFC87851.1 hypothetical protein SAMN05421848_3099 [Kushneria avicenniae]